MQEPEATELTITEEERKLGVVSGMALSWDRTTACVLRTKQGHNFVGYWITPLGHPVDTLINLEGARRQARQNLLRHHERQSERRKAQSAGNNRGGRPWVKYGTPAA